MNVPQRFREQYVANLRWYRRTAFRRLLYGLLAIGFAFTIGGLLHATQDVPLLFYPLVAFLVMLTALLVTLKLISLGRRTYDESRYIFQGDAPPGEMGKAPPETWHAPSGGPHMMAPPNAHTRQEPRPSNYSGILVLAAILLPLFCLGGGTAGVVGAYWWVARAPQAPVGNRAPPSPSDDMTAHHRDAIRQLEQSTQALEQKLRRQEEMLRRGR